MSLLKWLKKIFEIKPVQPKVNTPVVKEIPVVEDINQPVVVTEPKLNVMKEGCVVELVARHTPEITEESSVQPIQPIKKKRTRKPKKPKDYNG